MLATFVPEPLAMLFLAVGAYVSLRIAVSFVLCLYNVLLRGGKSLKYYGAGTDSWAVVTGASDGIGKEYALQLARAGFDVVLVARSKDKLDAIATKIINDFSRQALVIPFDCSTNDSAAYEKLLAQFIDLRVRVLINNVGMSHEMPCDFTDESLETMRKIINVNVNFTVNLTHAVARRMYLNSKTSPSLIVNVGSFAGLYPQPMLGIYSASKAFLLTWTQALAKEAQARGGIVDVTYLAPYYVASAMSKIRSTSLTVPSPGEYVRASLTRIGNPGGSALPFTSTPHPAHAVINWAIDNFVPPKVLLNVTHSMMAGIRARALRKRAREAKAQ